MEAKTNIYLSLLLKLTLVIFSAAVLFGCMPKVVLDTSLPNVVLSVPSSAPAAVVQAPSGNSDAQYIQPTDYFYMEEPFGDTEWERVTLGKLVTPPSPETKDQAQFMNAYSGVKEWAKWWALTRIASSAELKLGQEVIFFDTYGDDSTLRAPESTQDARSGNWGISRITDMSEMFKGYVMIGGGYKVSVKNLRVIVR